MKKIIAFLLPAFISCKQNNVQHPDIDSLKTELSAYTIRLDSMQRLLDSSTREYNQWFDKEYDAGALKGRTSDPEKYIEDELRKKPQLIPMSAVLGGTMHYNKIQVIGNKWVIADYDDGHVMGMSIFRYIIKKNGEIEFKLIDASEDGSP